MNMKRKIIFIFGLITVIPCLMAYYLSMVMPQASFLVKSLLILITCIIGVLGGVYLVKLIELITKLYEKLNFVAEGNFVQEVKAPTSEVDSLAVSINKVTKKLRENANELEKRAILIERSAQELRRRDEIKTTYLSTVAHELRAPLINIDKSSVFLIEEAEAITPEDKSKFLKIINSSAQRLLHMVNDLLDMSKLEAGEMVIQYELLDIQEVINEAIDAVERWRLSKKIELIVKITPNLPKVYADKDRVIQIIINLLSNAIKFTGPNGKIVIESKIFEKSFLMVSVEDTGVGFSDEQSALLFVRYKLQQEVGSYNTLPNTGLGLPIAKQIVELHGGKIWAKSEPNKGSKFSFSLPLELSSDSVTAMFNPNGLRKKILVIDDEATVRELLCRELVKRGYYVDTASDGFEGFKQAMKNSYDLVITDVRMPNMDGIDCINILKKIDTSLSIIVVTGFPVDHDLKDVLKNNAYICVKKPFDLPEFLKTIENSCLTEKDDGDKTER
ncbi:MAG: response regulator [PVC group bacterium]|nr:response regulator [PVC group bacterium]